MPIDLARSEYEKFFARFPLAGAFWKQYIDREVALK
jgi:hypothetical protein